MEDGATGPGMQWPPEAGKSQGPGSPQEPLGNEAVPTPRSPEHQEGLCLVFSHYAGGDSSEPVVGDPRGDPALPAAGGTWCRELFFIFWVQEEPPRAPSCAVLCGRHTVGPPAVVSSWTANAHPGPCDPWTVASSTS